MTLREQIEYDYLQAYKDRSMQTAEVLRLIKSALKNEAIKIDKVGTLLTDQQAIAVLNREAKQRKDSITQFQAAGRNDLADKEIAELAIIKAYLPKSMSEDEIQKIVEAILAETKATQKSDMGKVMGALKEKLTNPADRSHAAALVQKKLTSS